MKTVYLSAGLLLLPGVASAHPAGLHGGSLVYGLSHPVTGIDHLAAMVAVGIMGAVTGGRALWMLPLTFLTFMIVGALVAGAGIPLIQVEPMIVLSLIILGSVLLLNIRISDAAVLATIAVFALFHGYAHGAEAPDAGSRITFILGFSVSTALLHFFGAFAALSARKHKEVLARAFGFVIAGFGLFAGFGLLNA